MKIKTEKENEPDKVLTACAIALECLSQLLVYAHSGRSYMDDYDAACRAAKGIKALSDVLGDMGL